jgi:hypothetical protein
MHTRAHHDDGCAALPGVPPCTRQLPLERSTPPGGSGRGTGERSVRSVRGTRPLAPAIVEASVRVHGCAVSPCRACTPAPVRHSHELRISNIRAERGATSVLDGAPWASHPVATDMATVDAAALASQLQTLQAQVPPRPHRATFRRCSDGMNSRTGRAGWSCPFTHLQLMGGSLPAEGAPGSFPKWGCGYVCRHLRRLGRVEGPLLPGMTSPRRPQLPSPRGSRCGDCSAPHHQPPGWRRMAAMHTYPSPTWGFHQACAPHVQRRWTAGSIDVGFERTRLYACMA